jgi:hypothetical protein
VEKVIKALERGPQTPMKVQVIRDLKMLQAHRKRKALAKKPASA